MNVLLWNWQGMGMRWLWAVTSAWYQSHTHRHAHAVNRLQMHTPPLYRAQASVCECAAIAYSSLPPPTVEEREGSDRKEGRISSNFKAVSNNIHLSLDWQKEQGRDKLRYLILESRPPQQPPSDGYIRLWIEKRQPALLFERKLASTN